LALSFSYRKEISDNKIIYRPKIPIILRKYRKQVTLPATIDSGSDVTVIPREVAEFLELDISDKKRQVDGIGGAVQTIETTVNLEISKGRTKEYIPHMPVKVLLTKSPINDILLGRVPFFSKFDITFKENARRVILTKSTHELRRLAIEEKF